MGFGDIVLETNGHGGRALFCRGASSKGSLIEERYGW
jgi:hypothetical protein